MWRAERDKLGDDKETRAHAGTVYNETFIVIYDEIR